MFVLVMDIKYLWNRIILGVIDIGYLLFEREIEL